MGIQQIIVTLVAIAAAVYVIRFVYRSMAGRKGCGCDTTGASGEPPDRPPATLKRQPFVPLDDLTGPDDEPS